MWQVLLLLGKLSCTSLRRMALPRMLALLPRWALALLLRWELAVLPMLEAMHPMQRGPGRASWQISLIPGT